MSRSDDLWSKSPETHVTEELAPLIAGELDLDATRGVTQHLRTCPECRAELVEIAAGVGLMRRLDAAPGTAATPSARPTAASPPSRRKARAAALAVAAVVLLLVGVVTAGVLSNRSDAPQAKVELTPVANGSADGTVAMRQSGTAQAMEVNTSLGQAPTDRYYEVWLLDRTTGKMLAVGVLPPDGQGTFRLPSQLLTDYDSVDISLQPNDGSTKHSSDSVLRANYA